MRNKDYLSIILVLNKLDVYGAQQRLSIYYIYLYTTTLMYMMRNKGYLFIIHVFNNLDVYYAQQRLSIYYTCIKQP